MKTKQNRTEELKNKIWTMSKPANEWVSSYLVVPALEVCEIIEEREKEVLEILKNYGENINYNNGEGIYKLKEIVWFQSLLEEIKGEEETGK